MPKQFPTGLLKVFIIHSPSLDIRKQHIKKFVDILDSVKIDYEYVESYEPNKITQQDVQQKVDLSKKNTGELFDELVRNLHVNQISNALKHCEAINLANKVQDKYENFLFVEDDILFGDDMIEKLREALTLYRNDTNDILFLGLPSLAPIEHKNQIQIIPTTQFYKLFPCCESYLIKAATISKIAPLVYPIKYVTNFQLSYIATTNNLQTTMVVPNIFLDGSKYGAFLSSIDPNNKMLFNPEFIKLANLVQSNASSQVIESTFDSIKFRNHPDVMHLQAIYLMSKGDYAKAETILENILQLTTQNGCIINNETEFLLTYMRLHKFTQDLV